MFVVGCCRNNNELLLLPAEIPRKPKVSHDRTWVLSRVERLLYERDPHSPSLDSRSARTWSLLAFKSAAMQPPHSYTEPCRPIFAIELTRPWWYTHKTNCWILGLTVVCWRLKNRSLLANANYRWGKLASYFGNRVTPRRNTFSFLQ